MCSTNKLHNLIRFLSLLLTLLGGWGVLHAQGVRSYCIEISCSSRSINSTQSALDFSWPSKTPSATYQYVYKKLKGAYQWGSVYRTLGNSDSTFSDTITTGQAFEYMVEKGYGPDGWPVYGYIYASNRMSATTDRGIIILIADSTHKTFLENSIRTYRNDLIGDGWSTILKWVSPSTTVPQIKSYIYNTYTSNPSRVKSVVLIGNIAVPYSGDFDENGIFPPDGHTTNYTPPSHEGAWSTDLYYGDMFNATWPDASVSNTAGARPANRNVPSDGKFDITELPNILQLQIGRIDLSEMTEFKYDVPDSNNIERELLKRYFEKNHSFRHKLVTIQERCLYANTYADVLSGPPIDEHWPTNAYRNMSVFFGKNVVSKTTTYRNTLNSNSYLWSFAFGAGNYNQSTSVGYSINLASTSQQLQTVFAGYLGSYFADFDTANNFMRAALASKGNVLNTFWVGRPSWYFHHMALGETIGYSALRTQSNYDSALSAFYGYTVSLYPTAAYSAFSIHSSLLGDPTVRLQPLETPSNFYVRQDSCNFRFKLRWTAPSDTAVHTYYIFRAKHIDSTFSLLGTTINTSYTDNSPLTGTNVYMLRGSKLQVNSSGSYFNLSQGLFDTVSTSDFNIPTANAGADTIICSNYPLRIGVHSTNTINTTFNWTPSSGNRDTVTILATNGNRILAATDTLSGCIVRDTMQISVLSSPVNETISFVNTTCNDTVAWSSTNNNGSAYQYDWTFTGGNPGDTSGLGLINPGVVIYNFAGNYSTSLSIRDTSTDCVNTINSVVSVICIGLPVQWANLTCNSTGEKLEIRFNIENSRQFKAIEIEAMNSNLNWVKIKTLTELKDGEYVIGFESASAYIATRLVGIKINGETDILDVCHFDMDANGLLVYPNPVISEITLELTKSTTMIQSQVVIYNSVGQIVFSQEHSFIKGNLIINCTNWNSGIYTVLVTNGEKVFSLKIVK